VSIPEMPRLSLIIPTFNEEKHIRSCLESIFENDLPASEYEVIVVDNGSTDSTRDIVKQFDVSLYIMPDLNVGGVRNFGAEKANGSIFAFLDGDCVIDPDWLHRAISRISEGPQYAFGGQYLLRSNPSWLERYWVLNDNSKFVEQTTLVGGCIVVPREAFFEVGKFDETMLSGEDSDLTKRLNSSGITVVIDPSLSVVHLGYPSTVRDFIRRQIWHSLSYIDNFPASLSDRIFILTILFSLCVLISIFALFVSFKLFVFGFISVFACTAILSFKRVRRSRSGFPRLRSFFPIFAIDFLYLVGRSVGVCSSAIQRFGLNVFYYKKG